MSRYIDADELKKVLDDGYTKHFLSSAELVYVDQMIDNAPTADVQPVVRCKDCKHYYTGLLHGDHECQVFDMLMNDDDYCSQGERREE